MRNALCLGAALCLPAGVALADVTAVEDLRRSMQASIEGTVVRISDEDEFILADGTGQIHVYIGPNPMPVREGDRIGVAGFIDDDLRMELYADTITRADGEVVALPNRD